MLLVDFSVLLIAAMILMVVFLHLQRGAGVRLKPILALGLFVYHSVFCVIYYELIKTMPADANMYYRVGSEIGQSGDLVIEFGLGTDFVIWLVAHIQRLFDLQKLTLFLLFSMVGFTGLLFLLRAMSTWLVGKNASWLWLLLFMPGLSFWTSSIGKDSLIFFALCYLLYAILHFSLIRIALALLVIMLIRPHVGIVAIMSLSLALMVDKKQLSAHAKWLSAAILLTLLVMLVPFVTSYVGLSELSLQAIVNKIEAQSGHNQEGGGALDITQLSLPGQIFAYLFRPIFFDAKNMLGVVVSFENAIYLGMCLMLLRRQMISFFQQHKSVVLWFSLFFFAGMTLMMATTTANSGIAVRQKMMFFPYLIFVFVWFTCFLDTEQAAKRNATSMLSGVTS